MYPEQIQHIHVTIDGDSYRFYHQTRRDDDYTIAELRSQSIRGYDAPAPEGGVNNTFANLQRDEWPECQCRNGKFYVDGQVISISVSISICPARQNSIAGNSMSKALSRTKANMRG